METAKATVEVPAPFAGVVARLHAREGDVVAVGAALLTVEQRTGQQEPGVVTAPESGHVLVGYGTSTAPRRHRRRLSAVSTPAAAGTIPSTASSAAAPSPPAPSAAALSAGSNGTPVISPLVRKLARDSGIDVSTITGSGPTGTVLRRDVDQARAARTATAAPSSRSTASSSGPGPGDRRIPMTGGRRIAADRFATSRREIPEATVWVDVDATGLLAARTALTATAPDQPVGLLALLARFVVLGLRRYPELNARVEPDAVVLLNAVHLGIAAQTDRGLVVPVVRDAHRLTTRQLAGAIGERAAQARAGALAPAELSGGTFTVNNYGVFGVDGSAAIINHPEVGILGMGRITQRPWVVDGTLAIRSVTQLTLAFDHRACDGAVAGGFLRFVADCVESPVIVLGEV